MNVYKQMTPYSALSDVAACTDMVMNGLTDSIDTVIHRQAFIKSNTKDFNVVSQWDLGACNVDSGKIRVAVRPLMGNEEDRLILSACKFALDSSK